MTERVAAVYAEEWPRCVAILTRVLGDLERAEDAARVVGRIVEGVVGLG